MGCFVILGNNKITPPTKKQPSIKTKIRLFDKCFFWTEAMNKRILFFRRIILFFSKNNITSLKKATLSILQSKLDFKGRGRVEVKMRRMVG